MTINTFVNFNSRLSFMSIPAQNTGEKAKNQIFFLEIIQSLWGTLKPVKLIYTLYYAK